MRRFIKKNQDWLFIAGMIGICWFFGKNLLFTKIGFPAMCSMFVISCVLSFFLKHVLIEDAD